MRTAQFVAHKISTDKYYSYVLYSVHWLRHTLYTLPDYLIIIMISVYVAVFVFLPSAVLLIFRSLTVQFINLHILQKILWVPFCKEIFLSSFWVNHFFFFFNYFEFFFIWLLLSLSSSSSSASLTEHSLFCVFKKSAHNHTTHNYSYSISN